MNLRKDHYHTHDPRSTICEFECPKKICECAYQQVILLLLRDSVTIYSVRLAPVKHLPKCSLELTVAIKSRKGFGCYAPVKHLLEMLTKES